MELNAIYENGRLYFDGPFKFKMKRVPVRIVVDDESVLTLASGNERSKSFEETTSPLLKKIHSLFGPDYAYIPTNKADREMLSEALEEKYLK